MSEKSSAAELCALIKAGFVADLTPGEKDDITSVSNDAWDQLNEKGFIPGTARLVLGDGKIVVAHQAEPVGSLMINVFTPLEKCGSMIIPIASIARIEINF